MSTINVLLCPHCGDVIHFSDLKVTIDGRLNICNFRGNLSLDKDAFVDKVKLEEVDVSDLYITYNVSHSCGYELMDGDINVMDPNIDLRRASFEFDLMSEISGKLTNEIRSTVEDVYLVEFDPATGEVYYSSSKFNSWTKEEFQEVFAEILSSSL